jgi:hypothetical protein
MTWWGVQPNAVQVRVASWNLAISRYDTTRRAARDGDANDDGSPTHCPAFTCPPTADPVYVALALLFSLS